MFGKITFSSKITFVQFTKISSVGTKRCGSAVGCSCLLLSSLSLLRHDGSLSLQPGRGHKSLDSRTLHLLLGLALLQWKRTTNDVLAHIIILHQVEQLADFG